LPVSPATGILELIAAIHRAISVPTLGRADSVEHAAFHDYDARRNQ